jgi:hypothetical protein
LQRLLAPVLLCGNSLLFAGVLPDDRADVLYHSYDGGGVTIDGPSLLVLKKVGPNVALTGNYYVDSISSASIDVVTSASAFGGYTEERTELSGGIDYLRGNSTLSLSYTNSSENDYEADTASMGASMDMFANMTTVSMGYSRGRDTVGNNADASFSEKVDRQNYKLGVSQVITKDMIMELNYEGITDEGILNNPYRTVRWYDGTNSGTEKEEYPNTRSSSALAVRAMHYLPWRASVSGEYRFFTDTWGIDAHNVKLAYAQPFSDGWFVETGFRYYTQSAADFYSDLFPRADAQNFLARDKELSTFSSHTIGFKIGYDFIKQGWRGIDRGSLNMSVDHIIFEYDDFRDLRVASPVPGTEPLYSFNADVVQLFVSLWF